MAFLPGAQKVSSPKTQSQLITVTLHSSRTSQLTQSTPTLSSGPRERQKLGVWGQSLWKRREAPLLLESLQREAGPALRIPDLRASRDPVPIASTVEYI